MASWLTVKKRNYEEHCRDCDAGYDLGGPRLTWDEFCMQQTIDEDEFGPSDNVETIWRECNDEPWLRKEREFQYRMKLNRFFAVQKIKRQRREMEEKGKV
ncbi:hypothetical protein KC19_VG030300 [Ceratodon purpureus]|uniref:Uncharacterized protein n=1 Tax=Ceratodon purpureus TaxID=3225 RepID=A0A8T0HLI1_CERPU|nr:hypothetical protein KC19_VG030300 [Ceratodon purpureus]